tara:strand:+ start:1792 stop:3291 length:1500 start_codon:yes stop_codon:yes gene_type:complete
MKLLALRLDDHDSNVTYFDGEHLKYKSFERDYQFKHFGFDGRYSWTKILEEWNIKPFFVDAIAIVLDSHFHSEIKYDTQKSTELIEIPVLRDLGFKCPIHRVDHHYAHSLSFWPMDVQPTINFVFDGVGDDWMYRSVWREQKLIDCGKSNAQDIFQSSSLGFIMSHFGDVLNLRGNGLDHAGKVMALKAFGKHNNDVKPVDNIDDLNKLWDFQVIEQHLQQPQYIIDYLATAHEYTEQIYVKHFKDFIKPNDIVGYSGGIAQNTIINKALKDNIPNLVIPPHATDQGLSIGAIEHLRKEYNLSKLPKEGFPFMQDDEAPNRPSVKTIKNTAELLAQGKIVGWYQGHGEIGSRALGNRSILMSPFIANGKDLINAKVKHREPFRPFGASVLDNKVSNYFSWDGLSPYMLYVMKVLEPDRFPSITHKDNTCRVNTVSQEQEDFYMLLEEYEKLTGVPVLLNTSLNNNGRPIAGRIADAFELYYKTDLNALVVGDEIKDKFT